MHRWKVGALATLGIAVLSVGRADAAAILRITDSSTATVVTVTDESAQDLAFGIAGEVSYTGPVGAFLLTVDTGSTKPIYGSAASPRMSLDYKATKVGGGSATLTIEFIESGFTASGSAVHYEFGGSGGGIATYSAFVDGGQVGPTLVSTSTPYALSTSTAVALSSSYSLTQIVTLTPTTSVTIGGSAKLAVPEPSSIALLSCALLLLGFATWRHVKTDADLAF